ncbi:unnamed protein product [Candidula unifasciata]|uniref:Uncharacterized protein n=1 Tax=Candidula unifasciata TaxID=100452 RepID=A0A8S4A1H6_9EUPU|nr:unnamed protein product [Candidula unifasciata]
MTCSFFSNTSDIILILLATFLFCCGAGGHSHLEDEEEVETDHQSQGSNSFQTSWIAKRMSQMSCHCCSNSFNSHCCLQCMRSVGKRGDVSASLNPFEDTTEDINERFISVDRSGPKDATNDWTTNSLLCFCCLLQMDRQHSSSSRLWSCCDKCPDLLRFLEKLNIK